MKPVSELCGQNNITSSTLAESTGFVKYMLGAMWNQKQHRSLVKNIRWRQWRPQNVVRHSLDGGDVIRTIKITII